MLGVLSLCGFRCIIFWEWEVRVEVLGDIDEVKGIVVLVSWGVVRC